MERDSITCLQTLFPNPQRGQCICFRTEHLSGSLSLYSIPYDFFGDGGDNDDNDPYLKGLLACYKTIDFPKSSVLSSVGSSLFVVGPEGTNKLNPTGPDEILTGKCYRFDETKPADGWHAVQMLKHRVNPETVVMDGKIYVFGGGLKSLNPPFAEMIDPCLMTSMELPEPPNLPTDFQFQLSTAVLQPSKRILVASTDFAAVYNVVDKAWEEWDHKVDFSNVKGQAVMLRENRTLCWVSNNDEFHAYDLDLKRWFKSTIEGLDTVYGMRKPVYEEANRPLFPLDDKHLLWIWEELEGYEGTILPLVHITKIQVSIDTDAEDFSAAVVVSRSYVLLDPNERIVNAHVFLGEEDKGGIVKNIAPFMKCSICRLAGHTESDHRRYITDGVWTYGK